MEPFVSVVIDNYNYDRYLEQCLLSAVSQDYPRDRFEVILVDDGSTDGSREIAARFTNKIRLIAQENRGQAGAFNTGFAAALGDTVCLMDSDDYWEPDKIKSIVAGFKDSSAGIVQHYLRDVDAAGRPLNNPIPSWPSQYGLEDFVAGTAELAATTGIAFRKEILRQLLPIPPEMYYHLDVYLFVHGLFLTRAVNIPRILGYHRIHGRNNWAEDYRSPRKLELGLKTILAFKSYLDPKLKNRGLNYSPLYLFLEELEIKRREILLAMHQGRRGQAFFHWRGLWARYGRTPLGLFRSLTLLLALVSPVLYLKVYDLYRNHHWMARMRRAVFPEGAHA